MCQRADDAPQGDAAAGVGPVGRADGACDPEDGLVGDRLDQLREFQRLVRNMPTIAMSPSGSTLFRSNDLIGRLI